MMLIKYSWYSLCHGVTDYLTGKGGHMCEYAYTFERISVVPLSTSGISRAPGVQGLLEQEHGGQQD